MNGQFDLITLISLVVAAVAILKLRSVLGHRTDDDDQRVERLKTRQRQAQGDNPNGNSADIVTMPRRDAEDVEPVVDRGPDPLDTEKRIRAYPTADADLTETLLEIGRLDPNFEPQAFLNGAGLAYELIVSSFAEGNRKALKDLLSRDVLDGFSAAIGERESRGETVEQQFVGIKRSEIVEAELRKGVAGVTVRFVSELINSTLDNEGRVISGDPQKITDVTDIWTFSRDISTARARANPNWRLVATQAPN